MPDTTDLRSTTIDELVPWVGAELGLTKWRTLTQDAFAEVTGGHQWMEADLTWPTASPFGTKIGYGPFALSLGSAYMEELTAFDGFAHGLNYGYKNDAPRVSFCSPGGPQVTSMTPRGPLRPLRSRTRAKGSSLCVSITSPSIRQCAAGSTTSAPTSSGGGTEGVPMIDAFIVDAVYAPVDRRRVGVSRPPT